MSGARAEVEQPDRLAGGPSGRQSLLVDLDSIDLGAEAAGVAEIERVNPHRHEMRLLDRVISVAEDRSTAVGVYHPRRDAFWVRGHFPVRATMPGVVMIEAGAQLACYLWNIQQPTPRVAAFLRIDDAAFRRAVQPEEELLLLCREVKCGRRRFISDVQGVVGDQLAFNARLSGMAMEEHQSEACRG